jgi:hypothetical protein
MTPRRRFLFIGAFGIGMGMVLLSRAQDTVPPTTEAQTLTGTPASLDEKWALIEKNQKEILQGLETIEQNLNFAKARAMRGGRSS